MIKSFFRVLDVVILGFYTLFPVSVCNHRPVRVCGFCSDAWCGVSFSSWRYAALFYFGIPWPFHIIICSLQATVFRESEKNETSIDTDIEPIVRKFKPSTRTGIPGNGWFLSTILHLCKCGKPDY